MFNWVGNKIKYLPVIRRYAEHCSCVVDGMMGGGNVLLELAKTKQVIGNDIIPLMPHIFVWFSQYSTDASVFWRIIDEWKFDTKDSYYKFRDHSNIAYRNFDGPFDFDFLIKTILLLKMCSNSMVRFNSDGVFNQGFRGLTHGRPFIEGVPIDKWARELKYYQDVIGSAKRMFYHWDVMKFLDYIAPDTDFDKTLFIFDPPYLLETEAYNANTYTKEKEIALQKWIVASGCKFIYFNYLSRDGENCTGLPDFIKTNEFSVETINTQTSTGQGRQGTTEVDEVLVSNIETQGDLFEGLL